jgi:hypothetical protein
MTTGVGSFSTNLQNLLSFSKCSVAAFKKLLLTSDYSAVSDQGSCLTNVPRELELLMAETYPGYFWTPDDQCQAKFGSEATFCHVNKV